MKNKVTGPSTQEYLSQFYEELESENRGSLQDMEKMQSVDLNYWLPGDILQKADKMSMAHKIVRCLEDFCRCDANCRSVAVKNRKDKNWW